MTRTVMFLGAAALSVFGTISAGFAKPHDIRIHLKIEKISAIHIPTGCVSAVEYDDGSFVKAFITDPLCLPSGVTERFVPSREMDFHTLDPRRTAVITR